MDIYIKTRSYDRDYEWLPNEDKKVYSEKWLKNYTSYISQEKPSLIVKRENQLIKVFITDIPSKREDFSSTSIRYAIAFDVNSSENENINFLATIIKAWLYERFNADERGKIKKSEIGEYLDNVFTPDFVNKLMKSEANITNELDINILKSKCENEVKNIDVINNKELQEKIDESYYCVCNLKNKNNKDSYENINIFYTLLINNILTSSNINENIAGAFFSLVLRLESIANVIKGNEIIDNDYPKFICVDFTDYNIGKINKEVFDIKIINDFCLCLKKKLQNTAKKSNTNQYQEIQIQSQITQMEEMENNKNSGILKIIVIALILSIAANLGIIIKLVLQTNLIENLTTKNQMIENKNIEMEAIIKDLKGKNQEAQSKLQISEHINQEKEKLSQRINVLTEENKTLKLQLQNHQKKEKLEE